MKISNHSSRAIVLSTEDFGEADKYILFLSEKWGVLTALAKSGRKSQRRFVGGLDLFCHNEIFFKMEPREKSILIELKVLNSFPKIRDCYEKMLVAGKILQWTKKLTPPLTPIPKIFSLVGQTLTLIANEEDLNRLELLVLIFKLKLLSELGLKPRVEACAKCNEPVESEPASFDMGSGGILCPQCHKGTRLHENLWLNHATRSFINFTPGVKLSEWGKIHLSDEPTQFLSRLITQFTSYHTHTKLPV